MPALDRLPIKKTNRLEDVAAFIQAGLPGGPAPGFKPSQTELPSQFRAPDF
jgi:hypothetical protein